jgi:hypothetical protein
MRQRAELIALAAAGLAFAVWEGGQRWPSVAAHWSVGLAIGGVVVAAVLAGRGRQPAPSGPWLRTSLDSVRRAPTPWRVGAVIWVILIGATIAWDLTSFIVQSHQLPTFSYLVGRLTRFDAGRVIVFGAWLTLGGYLALGRRR